MDVEHDVYVPLPPKRRFLVQLKMQSPPRRVGTVDASGGRSDMRAFRGMVVGSLLGAMVWALIGLGVTHAQVQPGATPCGQDWALLLSTMRSADQTAPYQQYLAAETVWAVCQQNGGQQVVTPWGVVPTSQFLVLAWNSGAPGVQYFAYHTYLWLLTSCELVERGPAEQCLR